jgi:hypothetical protein
MKKLLPIMLVMAMTAASFAAVQVTAVGNGANLEVYVNTTAGEVVRGLAVVLNSDGPLATGAVVPTGSPFNAFIDYYFTNDTVLPGMTDPSELPGAGAHPLADVAAAGEAALPAEDVSLSMGVLDNSGAQGGVDTAGTPLLIATVSYSGTGNVCLASDALRGGIVGENITEIQIQTECVAVGGDPCRELVNGAYYDRYVAAGKDPSCWCWQYQCRGDADGLEEGFFVKVRIGSNDLNAFLASWNKTPENGANPCSDFDHAEEGFFTKVAVGSADLNIFLANWQKGSAALTACPTYLP